MANVTLKIDQGHNDAMPGHQAREGELRETIGCEYRPGDSSLWKQLGRTITKNFELQSKGIHYAQFDSKAQDQILVLVRALAKGGNTGAYTLKGKNPRSSNDFTDLKTGLDDDSGRLSVVHYNDRQYITNGVDKVFVLENDGTVRDAGMVAPQYQITATAIAATGAAASPTALTDSSGTITSSGSAFDDDLDTFAGITRSTAGTSYAEYGTFASNTDSSRSAVFTLGLAGQQIFDPNLPTGGPPSSPPPQSFDVTINLSISEDNGSSYTDVYTVRTSTFWPSKKTLQFPVSANSNLILLKASLQYHATAGNPATLRIYEERISAGNPATDVANFDTDGSGLIYAVTEFDEKTGLQSPPGPVSERITMSSQNHVSIAGIANPQNSNATHLIVYRSIDGGTVRDLGEVGRFEVGSGKTFIDNFRTFAYNVQAGPPLELQLVDDGSGVFLIFVANQPPPVLDMLAYFQGSLCGIKGRGLFYSLGGRPESWTEINAVDKFPFEEHDTLIGLAAMDDVLVLGGKQVMIALNTLPQIDSGVVSRSEARKIEGAPGLLNQYCIVNVSDSDDSSGGKVVVWASRFGVHVTNGFAHRVLTADIDWRANVTKDGLTDAALFWDKERQQIRFQYEHNRFALIHMSEEHQKDNAKPYKVSTRPKITWGHYGKAYDFAGGFVDDEFVVWSMSKDGQIFRERDGLLDASCARGPLLDNVYMKVSVPRKYAEDRYWYVNMASVRHSDGGNTEATLTVTSGFDDPKSEKSVSQRVSMSGAKGSRVAVMQSSEWHEVVFEHDEAAEFRLEDIRLDADALAEAGAL